MTRPTPAPLAFLSLLAGATAIGFAPVLVRLSETGAVATAFYRLLLSLPFLWGWLWAARSGEIRPPPGRALHLAAAGALFALDMAFWCLALLHTSVGNATLLTNTAPIFVTLGAWLLFREAIGPRFLCGLLLTLSGMVVLAGLGGPGADPLGDSLSLVAALFYGGYMLYLKWLRRSMAPVPLMAWTGLSATLVLGAMVLLAGEEFRMESLDGFLVLLALALVGQVLGQTLIAHAFRFLPASFSSVGLLWQPVVAVLLAYLALGEAVAPRQLAGGAIILAGILLCRKASPEAS